MDNFVRTTCVTGLALSLLGCANPQSKGVYAQRKLPAPGGDGFLNDIGDKVFFDFDSALIRRDAQITLAKQAGWLNKYPTFKILIAGNCDERGTEEYDLALGFRRANADREVLIAKGVAAGRLSVISYGKERPLATGDDEQAWAMNRNATSSMP